MRPEWMDQVLSPLTTVSHTLESAQVGFKKTFFMFSFSKVLCSSYAISHFGGPAFQVVDYDVVVIMRAISHHSN